MIQRVVLCGAVCLSSVAGQPTRAPNLAARVQLCKSSASLSASGRMKHKYPRSGKAIETGLGRGCAIQVGWLAFLKSRRMAGTVDNKVVREALGFVSYDDFRGA